MLICYLDESGGCEDPDGGHSATPVMVILGLIVDAATIPLLTRDFLALKRKHFPGRYLSGHALDHILVEVKGSEILQMTRSPSRNLRRKADRLREEVLELVESHDGHLVGRVWVKEPGQSLAPHPTYCYAVQDISRHFSQHLNNRSQAGILIADGRTHTNNLRVAHSIFTQKWRTGGDPYPALREVPLFAASDNHAGLQLADLIATTLVFPMAATAYTTGTTKSVHESTRYENVRRTFGSRVKDLQFRYRDETGRWRGGLVVSDPVSHRSGSRLFG